MSHKTLKCNYSFLYPVFKDFRIKTSSKLHKEATAQQVSRNQIEQRIGEFIQQNYLTEEEAHTLIKLFVGLPKHQIDKITELQNQYSRFLNGQTGILESYLEFQVVEKTLPSLFPVGAWIMFHVELLGLPGLHPQGLLASGGIPEIMEPYRQCWWCGKFVDELSRLFPVHKNKNNRCYCHSAGCKNIGNSTPSKHLDCCLGIWGTKKKSFIRHLQRIEATAKVTAEEWKEDVEKTFLRFCEDLLAAYSDRPRLIHTAQDYRDYAEPYMYSRGIIKPPPIEGLAST
jgi:hypothetical protein